jgi:hypothetical protein
MVLTLRADDGECADDHDRDQHDRAAYIRSPWRRRRRPQSASQEIAQHGHKRQVGRGHRPGLRVPYQIARPDPFEGRMRQRLRLAVPAAADIKRHQKVKPAIGMRSKGEWRETGFLHRNAEFFLRSSRISAASGVSEDSILPPGNSHKPAILLPSGRCAISTRPSGSTNAAATTSIKIVRWGHDGMSMAKGD